MRDVLDLGHLVVVGENDGIALRRERQHLLLPVARQHLDVHGRVGHVTQARRIGFGCDEWPYDDVTASMTIRSTSAAAVLFTTAGGDALRRARNRVRLSVQLALAWWRWREYRTAGTHRDEAGMAFAAARTASPKR